MRYPQMLLARPSTRKAAITALKTVEYPVARSRHFNAREAGAVSKEKWNAHRCYLIEVIQSLPL